MAQAILTRWLPATDTKGSRISASAQAGRITVAWDHALNIDANHKAAAEALAARHGWLADGSTLHGGGLPNGRDFAWVMVEK